MGPVISHIVDPNLTLGQVLLVQVLAQRIYICVRGRVAALHSAFKRSCLPIAGHGEIR